MKKKPHARRRPGKAGRPRKEPEIPVQKIAELAGYGCTVQEIASVCGLSKDTIERNYMALIEKGRDQGDARLRKKQLELAMAGSSRMLIWLGKQRLNQRDKQEIISEHDPLGDLLAEFRNQHEQNKKALAQ